MICNLISLVFSLFFEYPSLFLVDLLFGKYFMDDVSGLLQLSGGCELTTVLQDFVAIHSNELSIQVGQTVELLEKPSDRPGWCLVKTTERSPPQEGLVPSSALCISHSRSSVEMECFFPSGKGRSRSGFW